jgi:hypothetical protein
MMTKTLTISISEMMKQAIIRLFDQLNLDYQNTREEQKKIAKSFPPSAEYFTILEEIELLTVEIRGYASQVKNHGQIKNETASRQKLGDLRFLDIPILSHFYFDLSSNYPLLKNYLLQLDYLRLLMLEFINLD